MGEDPLQLILREMQAISRWVGALEAGDGPPVGRAGDGASSALAEEPPDYEVDPRVEELPLDEVPHLDPLSRTPSDRVCPACLRVGGRLGRGGPHPGKSSDGSL